eukprot:gene820-890_t
MNSSSLLQLIEKTSNWDKDERYMATNDLCNMLSKDVKIDEIIEQKICSAILKQLDDPSNDVQSVAVKCLAVLVKKVHQNQIGEICKKLSDLVVAGQDALRDIYSIGLKTLIIDVSEAMGPLVCERLGAKLLNGVLHAVTDDAKRECLENLFELLKRFGHLLEAQHSSIVTALLDILKSNKAALRKRAMNCLGALAVVSNDLLLTELMTILLNRIQELNTSSGGATSQESRTLIQTIGTISRHVGHRLSRSLGQIIPLFITFCGDPNDESLQTEAANDLRESCFPGLESFVLHCPKEVASHIPNILAVSFAFLKYDPNYFYDSDNENLGGEDDDYGNEYDAEDFAGSEDDDGSWKVRKAAVKVIDAIITNHSQHMKEIFSMIAEELLSRFKEREENVKIDIIKAYTHLLQVNASAYNRREVEKEVDMGSLQLGYPLGRQPSLLNEVVNRSDKIITMSFSLLQDKSVKVKTEALIMLKTLVVATQGGLDQHLPKLFGIIENLLKDKNQTLKLEALQLLRTAFGYHRASTVQGSLSKLLPLILQAAQEQWFKIIAEALRLLAVAIKRMRPSIVLHQNISSSVVGEKDEQSAMTEDNVVTDSDYAFQPHLESIYQTIMARLSALDIDSEIKEGAIGTMGVCFAYLGDHLIDNFPSVLTVYQQRLENETTRLATLKAIQMIARSPLLMDLSSLLKGSMASFALFCKQYSRNLKILTLQTLIAIVENVKTQIEEVFYETILKEVSALVNDNDIYVAHLAIALASSLLVKNAAIAAPLLAKYIYPKLIMLARSSLTQGVALESLIGLLKTLVSSNHPLFPFREVFNSLYQQSTESNLVTAESATSSSSSSTGANAVGSIGNKQSLSNLAKCLAGISMALPQDQLEQTMITFTIDIEGYLHSMATDGNTSIAQKRVNHIVLALLAIGEIGQYYDLSHIPNLSQLLFQCFKDSVEEIKQAAAHALGYMTIGNMPSFLPLLLTSLSQSQEVRTTYLLLLALKENILLYNIHKKVDYQSYLDQILNLLSSLTSHDDDSIRNILSDCLGILTTLSTSRLVPLLTHLYDSNRENKHVLIVVASAWKSAFARPLTNEQSEAFHQILPHFFPLLHDEDLEVKRASLLMVNTVMHHNPQVISSYVVQDIYPVLMETLLIKLERVVDLGPFKHRVDDNLPLRKLCLACLETIMSNLPERFDANAVLQISSQLLGDLDDIKLLYLQMLPRICQLGPSAAAVYVEDMIAPLEKTIQKAAKDGEEKSSSSQELLKAIVRYLFRVDQLDEVKQLSRRWVDFSGKVRRAEALKDIVRAVEHEFLETH